MKEGIQKMKPMSWKNKPISSEIARFRKESKFNSKNPRLRNIMK